MAVMIKRPDGNLVPLPVITGYAQYILGTFQMGKKLAKTQAEAEEYCFILAALHISNYFKVAVTFDGDILTVKEPLESGDSISHCFRWNPEEFSLTSRASRTRSPRSASPQSEDDIPDFMRGYPVELD